MADVDINASYRDLSFADCEKLTAKRTALAEEVLQRFSDLGLTVETAEAVLKLLNERLKKAVNSCSVALLCTHRPCQQGSHTPQDTPQT